MPHAGARRGREPVGVGRPAQAILGTSAGRWSAQPGSANSATLRSPPIRAVIAAKRSPALASACSLGRRGKPSPRALQLAVEGVEVRLELQAGSSAPTVSPNRRPRTRALRRRRRPTRSGRLPASTGSDNRAAGASPSSPGRPSYRVRARTMRGTRAARDLRCPSSVRKARFLASTAGSLSAGPPLGSARGSVWESLPGTGWAMGFTISWASSSLPAGRPVPTSVRSLNRPLACFPSVTGIFFPATGQVQSRTEIPKIQARVLA